MTRAYEPELPLLPYPEPHDDGGSTAGWSGSTTSHERATTEAANGTATERQRQVLRLLSSRGPQGATWKETADALGWHHGQASGTLSVLHKTHHIERLATLHRARCAVYVLWQYVGDRETVEQGRRNATRRPNQREEYRVVTEGETHSPAYTVRGSAESVAAQRNVDGYPSKVQHRFVTEWEDVP